MCLVVARAFRSNTQNGQKFWGAVVFQQKILLSSATNVSAFVGQTKKRQTVGFFSLIINCFSLLLLRLSGKKASRCETATALKRPKRKCLFVFWGEIRENFGKQTKRQRFESLPLVTFHFSSVRSATQTRERRILQQGFDNQNKEKN